MKRRTALLVDDERLARRELAHLLAAHPDISVVGQAASVDEAATMVGRLDPDVIFLDIQMPRRSGFELTSVSTPSVRSRAVSGARIADRMVSDCRFARCSAPRAHATSCPSEISG